VACAITAVLESVVEDIEIKNVLNVGIGKTFESKW
jgi:hypothetical protein